MALSNPKFPPLISIVRLFIELFHEKKKPLRTTYGINNCSDTIIDADKSFKEGPQSPKRINQENTKS